MHLRSTVTYFQATRIGQDNYLIPEGERPYVEPGDVCAYWHTDNWITGASIPSVSTGTYLVVTITLFIVICFNY